LEAWHGAFAESIDITTTSTHSFIGTGHIPTCVGVAEGSTSSPPEEQLKRYVRMASAMFAPSVQKVIGIALDSRKKE
jgi:hypothetical protein